MGWANIGSNFVTRFRTRLVAQGRHPVGVFAGSWVGLAAISAAAVLLGRVLLRYVSLTMVQYVGAAVCAALAVMTLYGAFT